jgi:hypothetical protein
VTAGQDLEPQEIILDALAKGCQVVCRLPVIDHATGGSIGQRDFAVSAVRDGRVCCRLAGSPKAGRFAHPLCVLMSRLLSAGKPLTAFLSPETPSPLLGLPPSRGHEPRQRLVPADPATPANQLRGGLGGAVAVGEQQAPPVGVAAADPGEALDQRDGVDDVMASSEILTGPLACQSPRK